MEGIPDTEPPREWKVFATLTPVNPLAKMALDDIIKHFVIGRDQRRERELRIRRGPCQIYDKEVAEVQRHFDRRARSKQDADAREQSDTLPDTASDSSLHPEHSEPGLVWHGQYLLGFDPRPDEKYGWAVGKRQPNAAMSGSKEAELLLCTTSFADQHGINIRTFHARFVFAPTTSLLCVVRCSSNPYWQVSVNGDQISLRKEPRVLTEDGLPIAFGSLEYRLSFTSFASTDGFRQLRDNFLSSRGTVLQSIEIPTPSSKTPTRKVGPWVVSRQLGKGTAGRVFLGTHPEDKIAALKFLRNSTKGEKLSTQHEIDTNWTLTRLARDGDDAGRILKQIDVINGAGPDDDIVTVHEPVVPETLDSLFGDVHCRQVNFFPVFFILSFFSVVIAVFFMVILFFFLVVLFVVVTFISGSFKLNTVFELT